jgi:nitroreductase
MGIYEIAISRRAVRRYKDIIIPRELLERCVNAARLAPSAGNLQPLEYIVVSDELLLSEVYATLRWAVYIRPLGDPPEGKRPKAYIIMLKNTKGSVPETLYDIGAAMENIILVALAEGVASCPFASVDRNKIKSIFGIPENYEIPLVIALGYPDESPVEEPFTD